MIFVVKNKKMQKIKRIPYGLSDFERVNAKNEYYVDKTIFIPEIEKTNFVFFIRPRRFGKSLLLSTLNSYYDINKDNRFEEFYQNTWILENPTEERAKYMIMSFNFSLITCEKEKVQKNFNDYCVGVIDIFMEKYQKYLPKNILEKINEKHTAHEKLQHLSTALTDNPQKIYILIDEYDNFTNTLLAKYGKSEYEEITRNEGFFKEFFRTLKGMTTGSGAGLAKMFITGVSPITMDDVTSGMNMGDSKSTDLALNSLLGFTDRDVSKILDYYISVGCFKQNKDETMQLLKEWYDNYKFAEDADESVYNPDMILYFMNKSSNLKKPLKELIDYNAKVDYSKLRHFITAGNRLNGNFSVMEEILQEGQIVANLVSSFPYEYLTKRDNFISLLFFFGLITVDGTYQGQSKFKIPNLAVMSFMNDFITDGYTKACKVDLDMQKLSRAIAEMAYVNKWKPCLDMMAEMIKECMAVRDLIDQEKPVQVLFNALFHYGSPFIISSELEANFGFIDIALAPDLLHYPDMQDSYLIELKYLKKDEKYNDDVKNAQIAKAKTQLAKYAKDKNIQKQWQLKPEGQIQLTKIVVIFQGEEMKCYEELSFEMDN